MRVVAALILMAGTGWAQEKVILTPRPGPAPKINGPRVYGCRPGRPFLYRIPCTGARPISFSAEGLPDSLSLDRSTGVIRGLAPDRGKYMVLLEARNARGSSLRVLRIIAGDNLALTPPMGWSPWYIHYDRITDKVVRQAADVMISSGMADAGYQYVSIDDCWTVKPGSTDPELGGEPRDASGRLIPNKRFPDIKGLADYIHGKGLKAGIYTSPGPLTCAKFAGSYQHEEIDARTFADWGYDSLKCDECPSRSIVTNQSLEERKKPFIKMGAILKGLNRDIIYNLSQYNFNEVYKWAGDVGGNTWRTTRDLGRFMILESDQPLGGRRWRTAPNLGPLKGDRLPGFYNIGLLNAQHHEYAGPGRWNDPDYLILGVHGDPRNQTAPPRPTALTADEQYSYMSMWALMAAPLFFSGDMGQLDDFTLNILSNPEVIDVDQDPLGKQARILRQSDDEMVMVKPLEDGSIAVGLFNLSETERRIGVTAQDLGWAGKVRVRDVWRQKDLHTASGGYTRAVARHGVSLLRITGSVAVSPRM